MIGHNFHESYFSVHQDLILDGVALPFDLYINSSTLEGKEKFIRWMKKGSVLSKAEIADAKKKYRQLYIAESERGPYLRSITKKLKTVESKTEVIKDSAIKYLHTLFDKEHAFNTEVLSETIKGCRDAVESMVDVLENYSIEDLRKLIGNLSFHDFYTYDHSINVSMYCITIYKAVHPDAPRSELIHVGLGGLLHDLGKIKIPTDIINRPGGLSNEEYELIKKHPEMGLDLLLNQTADLPKDIDIKIIGRVINEHHENVDGTGYPRKLKAREIHFMAKVCAIADFFDAVTTKRSYNDVLDIDEAIKIMDRTVGKKIDGDIFKAFLTKLKRFVRKDTVTQEMDVSFDPTLPYAKFPLKLVEHKKEEEDFGKIKDLDERRLKNKKTKIG